jgi:hypothetical protein
MKNELSLMGSIFNNSLGALFLQQENFKRCLAFSELMNAALEPFLSAEKEINPEQFKLFLMNLSLGNTGMKNGFKSLNNLGGKLWGEQMLAFWRGELLEESDKHLQIAHSLVTKYPEAIQSIKGEFGFNYNYGRGYAKMAETDRFYLIQIMPSKSGVEVDNKKKPIFVVPPYVLGGDILTFLPGHNKSYVHAFANQGIPTYFRLIKPIAENPAVRNMKIEDDVSDNVKFLKVIKKKHQQEATVNGYCQGGLMTAVGFMTGKFKGLADKHITCVAPMDGTRSPGLSRFLSKLPERFRNLDYGKVEKAGDFVADARLMTLVYKLSSIANDFPTTTMVNDYMMLKGLFEKGEREIKFSPSALGINYWLNERRVDIPFFITQISFQSYTKPVKADGILPFTVFGKKISFKYFDEQNTPWLICIGETDELVEEAAALAPVGIAENVEVSRFPGGHVKIATSWSDPKSAFPLDKPGRPIHFHLR